MRVYGYNIGLQVNNKTIMGRTQDDLKISSITKESITKDDNGVKTTAVTGHDVTFSVSGKIELGITGGQKITRDDLLALALQTGSGAEISFVYDCGEGRSITGTCIITDYSESSDSEEEATFTVGCKATGAVSLSN